MKFTDLKKIVKEAEEKGFTGDEDVILRIMKPQDCPPGTPEQGRYIHVEAYASTGTCEINQVIRNGIPVPRPTILLSAHHALTEEQWQDYWNVEEEQLQ